MFNISKALIFSAAAILPASSASANDTMSAKFRFDRTMTVEQNYVAFQKTAKRACDVMSDLEGLRAHRSCRSALIAQAVSATRSTSLIAYHESHNDGDREVASLTR